MGVLPLPTREGFQYQLDALERGIVGLAVQVSDVLARAVAALVSLDAAAGRVIVAGDQVIDDREAELERDCLRLIALQQPVAGDLRTIGSALRILIDLEDLKLRFGYSGTRPRDGRNKRPSLAF